MAHDTPYHAPVMVAEVLRYLAPEGGGLYLDGTLGGGGHTEAILASSDTAKVIGVDRDPEAIEEASLRLAPFGDRVRLVRSNFAQAVEAAEILAGSLAGVLLDLGVSSHQIDASARGFTFRSGAPLDMRMASGTAGEATAADLLNELTVEELASIFRRYGEEKRARHMARIVGEMRERAPFERSEQLVEMVERAIPRSTVQDKARIFQALRIAVNREIEALEDALSKFREALSAGGVLVVLSYHSLEDRLVKDAFRDWSRSCICPPQMPMCVCRGVPLGETLTRKPLFASDAETGSNSRARSARLRAWRRA
ncbi:16S rRNA (cytosine(1402)-N(4))-methyltransferase RsmH [soil metagenome]